MQRAYTYIVSQAQAQLFLETLPAVFKEDEHFQVVRINLQQNILKSMLVSLFAKSIRREIPEDQWGRYLISNQNME
jgi:mitochondrial ATPase complex subunit ATP10